MTRYYANGFSFCTSEPTTLNYSLKKATHALVFKVNYQSADITAFLAQRGYRAKNGLLIAASEYPEFKDSKNVIFLQGKDSKRSGKLDTTRFVGNMQRDSKYDMINEALAEFVDFVRITKASQAPAFIPYSAPAPVAICYPSRYAASINNPYWPCIIV